MNAEIIQTIAVPKQTVVIIMVLSTVVVVGDILEAALIAKVLRRDR